MAYTPSSPACELPQLAGPAKATGHAGYLLLLSWAFALVNTLRMVAYLPTLAAIQASGDSSQHSLWTWGTRLGANLTMAAWLYEQAGRRANRGAAVNLGNALMCATAVGLIAHYR
jgi:hypothetical protein